MIDERWDPEVEEIAQALRRLLAAECPRDEVRRAEEQARGVSAALLAQLRAFGLSEMEGSAALFARTAFELGRALAPCPLVESMPVLALTGAPGVAWGHEGYYPAAAESAAIVTPEGLFRQPLPGGTPRRTTAGDFLARPALSAEAVRIGDAALAERCARFALLTGAARLAGAGFALLDYTRAYACEREQFGRPIGAFQAIGHRLATVAGDLDAAELLIRKAAFAAGPEQGGDGAPPLHFANMVWAKAVAASRQAATSAHQVFGGNGFAMDYDVQLFSRRIRAWALRGPRADALLADLGRMVLDPQRRDALTLLWHHDRGIPLPRWAREADAAPGS